MGLNLSEIRILVYDLDGTLYEDTHHFEIYARLIQSHLGLDLQEAFWADYTAAVAGIHPALRIGTFYDVQHDLVLQTRGGRVVRALHWDGLEAPPVVCRQLYPGLVQPDHDRIMNVGDLWWVPSAVSAHYGGEREKRYEAFMKVREIMSDPAFVIAAIPGLLETVDRLQGKVVQVVATNSPQPDSEAILRKIGLLGRFDRMFFRTNKPAGLQEIFQHLAEDYRVPLSAIASIGDNLVNEISPATALGCQTMFIDPHGLGDATDADMRVGSMSELMPVLCELAAS